MKKRVLLLCGGKSDEHEISLISAKHILEALDRSLFDPLVVGISKNGIWHLENEKNFYVGNPTADQIELNLDAPTPTLVPFANASGKGQLLVSDISYEFDIAFPILHGPFGEDGTLQGLFDIVGVPYVGANCGSSWICMDKSLTKILCQSHSIPVTDFVRLTSLEDLQAKAPEIADLGKTVFVKPARLGSSVAISKVTDATQLPKAVERAFQHDSKVLIERGIEGREIECAVLGLNRSAKVALPGEIVPSKKEGFYSYAAKYLLKDGAELFAPAKLDAPMVKKAQELALEAFELLECDGMARVDLFLERSTNKLYLNELNTIPGFTPISMYPKLWQASGLTYPELISQLIKLGFQRVGKAI